MVCEGRFGEMKKPKGLYKDGQLFGLVPPTDLTFKAPLQDNLEIVTQYYHCPNCQVKFPWQKVKDDPEPIIVRCALCKLDLKVVD